MAFTPSTMLAPPAALSRPSDEEVMRLVRLLTPWRLLVNPYFEGVERIPDKRPVLFVGNHTVYGLFDLTLLVSEMYLRKGVLMRALGDHLHFKIPFWREVVRMFGAVDGTRANCEALMSQKEAILVFPGGAREVAKRRGEKYKLMWKERLGFAHLAIRHGCTVVPFAAVGAEEAFEIVVDGNDILEHPLGRAATKLGLLREDFVLPIARPAPLRQLERFYFHFCDPIDTDGYQGVDDLAHCRELRDRTRLAIEEGINRLMERRSADPQRGVLARLIGLAGPDP